MEAREAGLLELFEQLIPAGEWSALEHRSRWAQIYSLPVLIEMMLVQRLTAQGTQAAAVRELEAVRLQRLLPDSERVREGRISSATGGHARACGRLDAAELARRDPAFPVPCRHPQDHLHHQRGGEPEQHPVQGGQDPRPISLRGHRPQVKGLYLAPKSSPPGGLRSRPGNRPSSTSPCSGKTASCSTDSHKHETSRRSFTQKN